MSIPTVRDVTRRHNDGLVYAHVACPHCGLDTTATEEGHRYSGTAEFFRCIDCREMFPIYTETSTDGVSVLRIGGPS